MDFSHPQLERLFYADIEGDFVAPDTGSFKFGLAVYGSANLYIDGKLVIENTTVQRGGNFFFGKGTAKGLSRRKSQSVSSKLMKPGVVNFGGAGRLGMI
jgi:beta-glucosidase